MKNDNFTFIATAFFIILIFITCMYGCQPECDGTHNAYVICNIGEESGVTRQYTFPAFAPEDQIFNGVFTRASDGAACYFMIPEVKK